MALNGVRSESPDAKYIRELERIIQGLLERVAKLERDRDYLIKKGQYG